MNLPLGPDRLISSVLDALLQLDPDSASRLRSLEGKRIWINVTSPDLVLQLTVDGARLKLNRNAASGNRSGAGDDCPDHRYSVEELISTPVDGDGSADVSITGTLTDLLALIRKPGSIHEGRVRIEGDISVANTLSSLFRDLDPDWADRLSVLIGDAAAHRLSRRAEKLSSWKQRTAARLQEDLVDFLQQEMQWLPDSNQVSQFCDEVDVLKASFDRLDARLKLLEKRHSNNTLHNPGIGQEPRS